MNIRCQLTKTDLQDAIEDVAVKTEYRAKQKGMGVMCSGHEILGIIQDEVQEYRDKVHAKSAVHDDKIEELKDIAVAAIWGIASMQSGGVDW